MLTNIFLAWSYFPQAKAGKNAKIEGRSFKEFPDSLIFLLRTFGLLRGLCTQLNVPVSYLDGMTDHARLGLMLSKAGTAIKSMPDYSRSDMQDRVRAILNRQGFDGGCQVCVRVNGRVLVDVAGGTMGDVDPRPCTEDSLMCLLNLTNVLGALAVLRSVGRGVELDSPLTGPKGAGPTLRMTLCHAQTGLEDSIPPSSFGHQLLDYDRCLSEVVRQVGFFSLQFPNI